MTHLEAVNLERIISSLLHHITFMLISFYFATTIAFKVFIRVHII